MSYQADGLIDNLEKASLTHGVQRMPLGRVR